MNTEINTMYIVMDFTEDTIRLTRCKSIDDANDFINRKIKELKAYGSIFSNLEKITNVLNKSITVRIIYKTQDSNIFGNIALITIEVTIFNKFLNADNTICADMNIIMGGSVLTYKISTTDHDICITCGGHALNIKKDANTEKNTILEDIIRLCLFGDSKK